MLSGSPESEPSPLPRGILPAQIFLALLTVPFMVGAGVLGLHIVFRLQDGLRVSGEAWLLLAGAICGTLWFAGPAVALCRPGTFRFVWAVLALALPLAASTVGLALSVAEGDSEYPRWVIVVPMTVLAAALGALGVAWRSGRGR